MTRSEAYWGTATVGLVLVAVLVVIVGGCSEETSQPLRLEGASSVQEGDTIWVDVELEEDVRDGVADVKFLLHYTTAHLEGIQYEMGPLVRAEEARVQHYPSQAAFEVRAPLRSAEGDDGQRKLGRAQFRVKETAPRDVPSHLLMTDVELLRDDGSMRRIARGDTVRMAIGSFEGTQEQEAALDVGDQYTIEDTIRVGEVVAPDSARILVRGTRPNGTEEIVGQVVVPPGRHQNVAVRIDPDFGLEERKFAFLEAGLYRFTEQGEGPESGSDETVRRFESGGQPVQATFTAHYRTSQPESRIVVQNKELDNGTLVVDSVIATEPADLVIHRNKDAGPLIPGIIGKTRVGTGVNADVAVEIFEGETVVCGETLWPMLHVRSESEDQPYEIDYPIITEPVTMRCE